MLPFPGRHLDGGRQVSSRRCRRLDTRPTQPERAKRRLDTDATLLHESLAPTPSVESHLLTALAAVRVEGGSLPVSLGHRARAGPGPLPSQPRQTSDNLCCHISIV